MYVGAPGTPQPGAPNPPKDPPPLHPPLTGPKKLGEGMGSGFESECPVIDPDTMSSHSGSLVYCAETYNIPFVVCPQGTGSSIKSMAIAPQSS